MNSTQRKEKLELITTIESLSHDGRGICHIDKKTTFINAALPGEQIKCHLTKKHSRFNEGETLEVLTSSEDRVSPPCPHFSICGGCSMQHLSDHAQIEFKQKIFLEQLKHFGEVIPENLLTPIYGNTLGYRRKARLGVRYVVKKARLLIGFREKSSRYLADLQECHVLHSSVGLRLKELNQLVTSLSQYEHIPQVEVAVGDHEAALVFRHMQPLNTSDLEKLVAFGQQFGIHIYLQPNPPQLIQKLWPFDDYQRLSYSLPDFQITMNFHPLDFTQINGEINQLMLKQALTLLDLQPEDEVLDLFCGLGNFTLPMARFAAHVTGVEGNQEMVLRARENAEHNKINNVEFYTSNLMDPTTQSSWMKKNYNKILLDPPRSGAKEIIAFFPNFSISRIAYISCNPATLARDAKELVHKQGFKLKTAGIINMFPHTSHIEAIAIFEK